MPRYARYIIAVAGVLALVVPTAAQASSAARSSSDPAQVLVGRWVGSYSGYVNGVYVEGGEKFVITQAKGYAAKGTWQYREKGGRWSVPKPVQFVVDTDGDVDIWGQDAVGYYDGELRGDRLVFNYVSISPNQALRFSVTRR